jgi:syntaxin-binding protein 1
LVSSIILKVIAGLGLRLTPYTDSYEKKASLDLRGPYVYKGKLRDKRKRDKVDGGMSYDLSRYVPLVKLVLEDQVAGRMSTDLFPYIREPPPEKTKKQSNFSALTEYLTSDNGLLVATGNNPYSLRTMGSSWAVGAKKTGEQDNFKENQAETTNQESINLREYRKNGARVIVFIIGGMTFSEMRSSYEVMRERNREIIIGSTNVWNPSSFVDSLKKLNRKVEVTEDVVAPHRNSIAPRQSTASSRHSKNSVVPKTSSEDVSSLNSSKFIEEEDVPGVKSKGAMRGLRSKFTVKRKP